MKPFACGFVIAISSAVLWFKYREEGLHIVRSPEIIKSNIAKAHTNLMIKYHKYSHKYT